MAESIETVSKDEVKIKATKMDITSQDELSVLCSTECNDNNADNANTAAIPKDNETSAEKDIVKSHSTGSSDDKQKAMLTECETKNSSSKQNPVITEEIFQKEAEPVLGKRVAKQAETDTLIELAGSNNACHEDKPSGTDFKDTKNNEASSTFAMDIAGSDKKLETEDSIPSGTELKDTNNEAPNAAAMDVADHDEKANSEDKGNKDIYRETIELSDSDIESSDSEDSESSSVSSLSSLSGPDSDNEGDGVSSSKKKTTFPTIKARGELLPEDLPPLEELHISVPSSLCAEIGLVTSIVNTLVVIQAHKDLPALDFDSVLFLDNGSRALGLVFDVFGPVNEPLYCVRFNSPKHIEDSKVEPGMKVYYAPQTEHSKFVFLQQLLKMKGSDASGKYDREPRVQVDFSDDEDERNYRKRLQKGNEDEIEQIIADDDQIKRKRNPNEQSGQNKKTTMRKNQRPQQNQFGGAARTGPQPVYRRLQNPFSTPRLPQGPIFPPSFSVPPPPIPRTPMQQTPPAPPNMTCNYPPPSPQGNFNSPFQNTLHQNPSFGQLPFGQPQMDPRLIQFGTQIAQMMCALQSTSNIPPPPPPNISQVNVPPPSVPQFNMSYNANYPNLNNSNYYASAAQGTPSYSASPYRTPPPPMPASSSSNLPPPNVPPPSHMTLPNFTFGQQYPSTSASYRGHR